jgi:MFS family permease
MSASNQTATVAVGSPPTLALLSTSSAMSFVILLGLVSLFGDVTYQGGRSVQGQFLNLLGASAFMVGLAAGAGELLGYGLRLVLGYLADRTGRYWTLTIVGFGINLLAIPALALVGRWEIAIGLLLAERIGKAIRNPSRDAMLSYATQTLGRGWGFGLHQTFDRLGSFLGPLVLTGVFVTQGNAALDPYQLGFAVLLVPAILALMTLLIARSLFPRPTELESKTPQVGTSGYRRGYWWFVIAAGLVGAGFADLPLIAYHFKAMALMEDQWMPTSYSAAMVLAMLAGLLGGKLFDRLDMTVVMGLGALAAYLGSLPWAFLGMGLWGVGLGAQDSVMRAALADFVPADRRGTGYGIFHMAFGVFWFAGSALMGLLYDHSLLALVVFSVVVQLLAVPLFWIAKHRCVSRLREACAWTHAGPR